MQHESLDRRAFNETLAAFAALLAAGLPAQAAPKEAPAHAGHKMEPDMSAMPAKWFGKEQIAFLIYPDFTALDMVGPHYMLTHMMGATTHIVARTKDPVKSDAGLVFTPSASFDDCPKDIDVICVPGGTSGTLAAMQDEATLAFLADRGARAKYVTSVCTGSLVLGAAGLLDGYRATSHWITRPLLANFGAIPTDERVVLDRNRMTGAGVTSGLDFGLTLLAMLRDPEFAKRAQLVGEYDPHPLYHSGSPHTAPKEVTQSLKRIFAGFVEKADAASRASPGAVKKLQHEAR